MKMTDMSKVAAIRRKAMAQIQAKKDAAQGKAPDSTPSEAPASENTPTPKAERRPPREIPEQETLDFWRKAIETFKSGKREYSMETEKWGTIWIVPEYTEDERMEVVAEEVFFLAMIEDLFEGKLTKVARRK